MKLNKNFKKLKRLKMYKRLAKPLSYSKVKRSKKSVIAIAMHGSGVRGDTAKNNVDYFATGNKSETGAHFFVDRAGKIGRSVTMNRIAWSVGVLYNRALAKYWDSLGNMNTVSIELCDIVDKYPSKAQIKSTAKLIRYIRTWCPNVKMLVRHLDIGGKNCPSSMTKKDTWSKFLEDLKKAGI